MRFSDNLRLIAAGGRAPAKGARNVVTPDMCATVGRSAGYGGETDAMKLSAVDRCVELLSDSVGKLPVYVMDRNSKKRVEHPVVKLLAERPNGWMTPLDLKKFIEKNRLCGGNGYCIIERDPRTMMPMRLVPVQAGVVSVKQDSFGELHYLFSHPLTKEAMNLGGMDMIHVRGLSRNGYLGLSVLERAAAVISAGRSAQEFQVNYYQNGGHPSGVLQADADLSGYAEIPQADGTTQTVSKKELIRREWDKVHSGPDNAGRVAVLDLGLKYQPLTISNRDAQFVETSGLTVEDIARFFGVPLHMLQAGKQSYSSNEQNAIAYIVDTLMPIITEYEEELTYKLLTSEEIARGLQIRFNVMAELRGDFTSRAAWYRGMREAGVFSVNEIRELEDIPECEGGDDRYASLNYVPLVDWKRLCSERQNGGGA